MIDLFQRKRTPTSACAPAQETPKGLLRPESAASLLATPRREKLLEHIWQRTSLSRSQFATLYRIPLDRYAELVQQFPASENHHHAYPGGMLDHGLEIVAYALKLRQSHLLPAGASSETQAAQAEAWTAGVAYAALIHDIGKIAVDLQVEYADGSPWHPWHDSLVRPYRYRYRKDREYRLHSAAAGLLYSRLLDREILDWLSGFPDLWSSLLFVLAGQYEHAGILGELVVQADQASVAQELGGDPTKAMAAPKHALQRKLLDGLRYLIKEELKLNQPQASDGWLTQEALWLVSKTVSDKLRAHLLSQGIEGIPDKNTAVFNVLQDHGIVQPTPDGKAIWKATVTSDGGWSHNFTFLKLAPALIWEAGERPAPFEGLVRIDHVGAALETDGADASLFIEATGAMPSPTINIEPSERPGAVDSSPDLPGESMDACPATPPPPPGMATAMTNLEVISPQASASNGGMPAISENDETQELSESHFMNWLRHGIQLRRLIVNDAKALVHTVADTVCLVSPGIFQRYAKEHPQIAKLAKQVNLSDWEWAQKHFERLHQHKKQSNGLNIWVCEVTGPRKTRRLHVYLLQRPSDLMLEVPFNNPYLRLGAGDT